MTEAVDRVLAEVVLFFQLINHRYEPASTVLTSNKGFEEWGTILGDEVMAAALPRLMHHCHVVNIRRLAHQSSGNLARDLASPHFAGERRGYA